MSLGMSDVLAARERIRPHLSPTPLRRYPLLDEAVGHGVQVWVKHENHLPTQAFKIRNAVSALTRLSESERRTGVITATRGNHGQGLAWAGARLGVPVTIVVPRGNNAEKNDAMRALGAELIEAGEDYDEAIAFAKERVQERGLVMVHSTNHPDVLAGAGTITLEILEEKPDLDAMVIAVGGGSQAVGAITVAAERTPGMAVYGVQAEGASAIHDGWHAGEPVARERAETFADGLATRSCYELTFDVLRRGLRGFVTVSDAQIAEAVRTLLYTTHNLAEGAGAAGLAGLMKLAPELAGRNVGVILSGGNIDLATLCRVLDRSL